MLQTIGMTLGALPQAKQFSNMVLSGLLRCKPLTTK